MKAKDKPDYIPQKAEQTDLFQAPIPLSRVKQRILTAASDVAASDQAVLPSYLHSTLCQIGFPRNRTDARLFERVNGDVRLVIEAGWVAQPGGKRKDLPLPYGTRPRLILVHLCSEAVRRNTPTVNVGKSARQFLLTLGINESSGGKNGSYTHFRKHMEALAASRLTLIYPELVERDGQLVKTFHQTAGAPIRQFEAWTEDENGKQLVIWPGQITLTLDFYESLKEHAVPLRNDALAALKHSSLALDIYTWLAHRLCRINTRNGVKVYWANLREQFGQEYSDVRDFKRAFKTALKQALAVYPDAKVESITGGLLLKPSKPPVPKTMTIVDHHRKLIDRGMG